MLSARLRAWPACILFLASMSGCAVTAAPQYYEEIDEDGIGGAGGEGGFIGADAGVGSPVPSFDLGLLNGRAPDAPKGVPNRLKAPQEAIALGSTTTTTPTESLAPDNDACTGDVVSLSGGFSITIDGTLIDATDDLTTFCADTDAAADKPDVVYQLELSSDLTVALNLTVADFAPAMSLRLTSCTEEAGGDACWASAAAPLQRTVALPTGTYWLVIDSADGSVGDFTLQIDASNPACGDGIVDSSEECDPGGPDSEDGCFDPGDANECLWGETPSNTEIIGCPGEGPIAVPLSNDAQNPTIVTSGPHNNGSGASTQTNEITEDPMVCGWAASGPEHVFHIVPSASGTLHARIGYGAGNTIVCESNPYCGDFIMYLRQDFCDVQDPPDPAQQMACVDFDPNGLEVLELTAEVLEDTSVWLFVDGLDDTWGVGEYTLELWLL